MKELLLLRHGKAERKLPMDDYHRPLKDKGKRAAQRVGVYLARHDLAPDHIVTSPSERAWVTAQKCIKAMGGGADHIVRERRLYLADSDTLLHVLRQSPTEAERVLLVGHNPGLERLLARLLPGADDAQSHPMRTGSLARLRHPGPWAELGEQPLELTELVHAKQLPAKFPYPDAHGSELRDRPAYYYRQSSVIPYRVHEGRLEILIIASSQHKHWVVPKGIQEPGLDERTSAAKEAWEEAGAQGVIAEQPLGSYQYQKWGATCTCTVYPMAVTELLGEHQWQEKHRGRHWANPEEAIDRLRGSKLAPMILALQEQLRGRPGHHRP